MRSHVGPYRVEETLGRGGMGVVYRGVHEHLGRPVAIKALAPELTQQPQFKERFFAEAKTQAALQHPSIVGVYDLVEDGGEFFIVMEFVSGQGLDDRLAATPDQSMDLPAALGIMVQVLSALDYAHSQGVIHRDVKPSNVLITAAGQVKFTDFGIALLVGDKRLTASQSTIGTPTYMSPEQIARPRSVDHRTDIYSAAVVFFELLAGRPPFDDETEYAIKKMHVEDEPPDLGSLQPSLPPALVAAIAQGLAKDPEERFASAGLFLTAIQEAVPGVSPAALPAPMPTFRPTALDPPPPPSNLLPTLPTDAMGAGQIPKTGGLLTLFSTGKGILIAAGVAGLLVIGGLIVVLAGRGAASPPGSEATAESDPPGQGENLDAMPQPGSQETLPAAGEGAATGNGIGSGEGASPEGQQEQMARLGGPPPSQPASERLVPPPPTRTPPTPQPVAPPAPVKQKVPEAAPPEEETPPAQEPVPAAAEEAAEPEPSSEAVSGSGFDRFAAMEEVLNSLVHVSEQAEEACSDDGGAEDLSDRLESFQEAAADVRKIFRRATGTGLLGGARKRFAKIRGSQEVTSEELRIEIQRLSSLEKQVGSLMASNPPSQRTQSFWKQITDLMTQLRKLV